MLRNNKYIKALISGYHKGIFINYIYYDIRISDICWKMK